MVAQTSATRPALAGGSGSVPSPLSVDEIERRLTEQGRDGWLAWERHVAGAAGCTRPVRLRGRAATVDRRTGEVLDSFDSAAAPDGLVYKGCGTRRASVCPSCARTYQYDAYHLLKAGIAGSDSAGVPAAVSAHPLVFLTLTAPSFGLVHGHRTKDGKPQPCRARRDRSVCEHGRPTWCTHRHRPGDPRIGRPLCLDCYDHAAHVIWNHHAGELWRPTTIALRRSVDRLARQHGVRLRVSFGKVGEYQTRGVVHFHALLRLDAIEDGAEGRPVLLAPPACIRTDTLAELARAAAAGTRFRTAAHPDAPDGLGWVIGWGRQVDVRVIRDAVTAGRLADGTAIDDLDVASYLAKYATKSTEAVGLLAHRLTPDTIDIYADETTHPGRLIAAAWRLGRLSALAPPNEDGRAPYDRLRKWAHMLGFGGHFLTKSRAYSTTFAERRGKRARWRRRRHLEALREQRPDLADLGDDLADDHDDETTLVIGEWSYAGNGWLCEGDRALANASAAHAREYRELVREELRCQHATPAT